MCHYFGTRRFATDDRSTNVRRWEIDPSALIIGHLRSSRPLRNVVRISPERQAQRAA